MPQQLADELGAYESDPVGRLGYLQAISFRACRLVVDTGIHAKRWTREQGVKFFVEVNGSNPLEVASEVDRYCSWPGQACGYKVGHSEINRQREKAKTALGAKYDLKAFDDSRSPRRQRAARRARRRTSTSTSGPRKRRMLERSMKSLLHRSAETRIEVESLRMTAAHRLPPPASRFCSGASASPSRRPRRNAGHSR